MVAYSFKGRFAEPILAGTKRQTIRAHRKRHARPGEQLQLYTGMRTKHCRLIGRATCEAVMNVRLDFCDGRVESRDTGLAITQLDELDAFAVKDGFPSWRDMIRFWRSEHAGVEIFEGVLVRWGALL